MRRAQPRTARREREIRRLIAHQLSDAEVGDLHPTPGIQQDILRLDVPMEHALFVRILQRLADVRHDREGLPRRESSGPHGLTQIHPVHKLHDEVAEPFGLTEVVNRHNVRMVQTRQQTPLPSEPFGEGRVAARRQRQQLQRHNSVQMTLPGRIDKPHAAVAHQFEHFQLRKGRPNTFRGRRLHPARRTAAFRGRGGALQHAAGAESARRLRRDRRATARTRGRDRVGVHFTGS